MQRIQRLPKFEEKHEIIVPKPEIFQRPDAQWHANQVSGVCVHLENLFCSVHIQMLDPTAQNSWAQIETSPRVPIPHLLPLHPPHPHFLHPPHDRLHHGQHS